MRIENRLTVSLLIIFLLLGMIGVFGLVATKKIVSSFDSSDKELRNIVSSAVEIGSLAKRAETHLVLYIILHDEVDKDKFFSRHDDFYNQVTVLEKVLTEPEAIEILEKIKLASTEMMPVGQALIAAHEYDMKKNGIFEPERYDSLINKLHDYTSSIRRYGLELAYFETGFLNRQEAITAATELSSYAKRAYGHLMKFLILNNELDKRKFFLRYDAMVDQSVYLENRIHDPEALDILAKIKEQSQLVLPIATELIRLYQEDMKNDGRFIGERHVDELQKLYTVISSLRQLSYKLVQYNVGVEESKRARAITEAKVLQHYIIIILLAAFVIMIFLAYRLSRSILGPLKKLQAATVEIGSGNLTAEIDISRHDEFGELATSFKRMADELHGTMISKDYVSRIIESMVEGMAVVNNNGIIETVNHALCRMTGYDQYELVGRPIISLIEERNDPALHKIFSTALVSKPINNIELSCKTKIGRLIPILFSRSPLFDVEKYVQGVVCIMLDITIRKEVEKELEESRDQLERRVEERTSELQKMNARLLHEISERRQIEDALQQSESYYRAIVEDQTELICRFRDNGLITFVNEACSIYFEKRAEELLEQKFFSFFPSSEQEKVEKLFKHLSVAHPVVDYICEIELVTGEMRWHHWTLRLILDRKNEPFEFQAVGRDITEQKDLEQKIQESAERIKFFAYSVSHDLKNPAINIYGLTKMLKKNYNDLLDEKGQKFCDQILHSSEQVTALVDKINQFITTAEAPLQFEYVDLKQVLKLIVDEFSSQFHLRNIQWSEPETIQNIRMDRLAFIRVMRNMIDNALKYGGEDLSEISIGYEETDQYHVLSISNNGVGIPEESYEKVFGLFEREQGDRKVEGAGLGLAIVREMTQRHKGKAWLGPDKDVGVIFYISISKFL